MVATRRQTRIGERATPPRSLVDLPDEVLEDILLMAQQMNAGSPYACTIAAVCKRFTALILPHMPVLRPQHALFSALRTCCDIDGEVVQPDNTIALSRCTRIACAAHLPSLRISDLRGFEGVTLARLTQLSLTNCKSLTSLTGLGSANLDNLLALDLSGCREIGPGVETLSGANLSALTSLTLSRCPSLRNLDGLQHVKLANLRALDVSFSGFSSFAWMASLPLHTLHTLDASGCPMLRSVDGFAGAGMTQLQRLDLGDSAIESLEGLVGARLAALTSLNLRGCGLLDSLEGVAAAGLRSLVVLDASATGVSTLEGLAGAQLRALRMLFLRDAASLHSLDGLESAGLVSLVELNIEECPLLDPGPLLRLFQGLVTSGVIDMATARLPGVTLLLQCKLINRELDRMLHRMREHLESAHAVLVGADALALLQPLQPIVLNLKRFNETSQSTFDAAMGLLSDVLEERSVEQALPMCKREMRRFQANLALMRECIENVQRTVAALRAHEAAAAR